MIHPKEELTYVMIKPDGLKRGLLGTVLSRIEKCGLKIVALEMETPSRAQMDTHYPKEKEWISRLGEKTRKTFEKYGYSVEKEYGTNDNFEVGKMVRNWLLDYMTSGPVVKMVVQGVHAVDMIRKMAGPTLPNEAEMGTIRGDYSVDSAISANMEKRGVHNILHASETPEEAKHEIAFWFKKSALHKYKRVEEDLML